MPLIELNTWPTMSTEEKKEFIYNVTGADKDFLSKSRTF